LANNQQVESVAYSVVIGKTNIATTGPATIILTVPPEWVTDHGGVPSIGVVHLSDDGISDILASGYTGTDNEGNLAFQAISPKGLSAFGLVGLKNQTGTAPVSQPQQPVDSIRNTPSGTIGSLIADNLVLLIGIFAVLLVMGVGIILYDRRSENKNKDRKKEQ
ncbi:MAG: hypothetical protein LUQ07_02365, partial [Methanospirillum sp.]|nr:hypothetical protein [Methanospirillum sp.]